MINNDMYIPPHLEHDWNLATEELRQASLEIDEASKRYHAAILARIAVSEMLRDWQLKN